MVPRNSAIINRLWRVARYPRPAEVIGAQHFEWGTTAVPEPVAGEFRVRTICLAPGPAQRGYLDGRHSGFYGEQLPLGAVMRGRGIGVIEASRHPDYPEGSAFVGSLGWQDYSIQRPRGSEFVFSTRQISAPTTPWSLHMGVLGQAGGTAYIGLTEAGALRAGDRVLISGAAGGVGSAAGQIARALGAGQVVGISGDADKCAWLINDLGFDAAINYRTEDIRKRLQTLFPDGIDLFFDNVGGETLAAALDNLAIGARIAVSGFIATQYADVATRGPANYANLIFRRARMQGFVYFDHWDQHDTIETQLKRWLASGELHNTETVYEGLEQMPGALAGLFTGAQRGIRICRVAPDPRP